MGLNVAKCTIPFCQRQYGWTETYFRASPSSTLSSELTALESLTSKRIKLSGEQTYVSYLKVSNENVSRDVRVQYYGSIETGSPYVGQSGETSDAPTTAVLIKRVGQSNTKFAPLYLRGVWDSLIFSGGSVKTASPTWNALYNAFVSELISGGWGFVAKDTATPASQNVTSVTQDANGFIVVVAAGNVFDLTQVGGRAKVYISGVKGAASVNGQQVVNVNSQTTCTTINQIPMFDYEGGGKITNNIPKFYAIERVDYARAVERKPGRPLYLSRGRQRVRKLA